MTYQSTLTALLAGSVTIAGRRQCRLFAVVALVVTGCDLFVNPDPPLATLRGVVTIDGVPAPNVWVQIESPEGFPDRDNQRFDWVLTDANGEFERQVPTGAPTITINSAEEREDDKPNLDCPAGPVTVDLRSGENRSLTFPCFDVTPFTLGATGGFDHNTGIAGQSIECKRITTSPPRPGATYSMTVEGPIDRDPPGGGVVPGQPAFSGTLDQNGSALVRVKISRFGTYRNTITATSKGGVARGLALDVLVNTGPSPNPCA